MSSFKAYLLSIYSWTALQYFVSEYKSCVLLLFSQKRGMSFWHSLTHLKWTKYCYFGISLDLLKFFQNIRFFLNSLSNWRQFSNVGSLVRYFRGVRKMILVLRSDALIVVPTSTCTQIIWSLTISEHVASPTLEQPDLSGPCREYCDNTAIPIFSYLHSTLMCTKQNQISNI